MSEITIRFISILTPYSPNQAQLANLRKTLLSREQQDGWAYQETEDGWTEGLTFEALPDSATKKIVLVEAGTGCARGGRGENGAMWVLQFEGDKFSLPATPEGQFSGWLYSIQPTIRHGFRDLVLGWHMGEGKAVLSYFRCDGKSYRPLGQAMTAADGTGEIVPRGTS
jgi:hypothetical protein